MATATGAYATAAALKIRMFPAGLTDTADDTLLGLICDQVNAYIESVTERVIAPLAGTPTRTYDVEESSATLYVPEGIRSVTLMEIAPYTGAAYLTLASTDYYLRPNYPRPGWPYTRVVMSNIPTSGYTRFPAGFATVRITGTFGWPAIPDDITEAALVIAHRTWDARQAGQGDVAGTDEFGRPVISLSVPGRVRDTLRRYSFADSLA